MGRPRLVLQRNRRRCDGARGCQQLPFYESFHGETGEGLGASHQTGWTVLVALMLQYRGRLCFDGPFAARGEHGVHRVERVMS